MRDKNPAAKRRRGRPPKREDKPIKVPLRFRELVGDILKTGPHPATKPKRPRKG